MHDRRALVPLFTLLVSTIGYPPPALAKPAERQTLQTREGVVAPPALHDEGCLECHSVGDLQTVDPISGREYRLALDIPGYLESSHGGLLCRACHARGYEVVPHRSNRRRDAFACLFCHRKDGVFAELDIKARRQEVKASVHHELLQKKKVMGQAVDFDCHSRDPKLLRALFAPNQGSAAEDEPRPGMMNDDVLDNVYVIGTTRSLPLDRASIWLSFLVSLLLLVHALVRLRFRAVHLRALSPEEIRSFEEEASGPYEIRGKSVPYPLWVRVWHTAQGLTFLGLLGSGLALHFPDVAGRLLPFDLAIRSHNVLGGVMVGLLVVFLTLNTLTSNRRHYRPRRMLFAASLRQTRYYLTGFLRGEPFPFRRGPWRKFNPLQQLSYLVVMYGLLPLSALTGLLLFFPELAPEEVAGAGGVWPVALLHLGAGWLLSVFLAVHLYMITTGPTVGFYLLELMGRTEPTDPEANENKRERAGERSSGMGTNNASMPSSGASDDETL